MEEQFYLVWPMTLYAFSLWRRPRVLVTALLLGIAACPIMRATLVPATPGGSFADRIFGVYSGLMQADSLIVGCLAAFLVRRTVAAPAWLEAPALRILAIGCVIAGRYAEITVARTNWPVAFVPRSTSRGDHVPDLGHGIPPAGAAGSRAESPPRRGARHAVLFALRLAASFPLAFRSPVQRSVNA